MLVQSGCSGVTSSAADSAPLIRTQPSSQTITAGQTATFSVAASGTAPLNYQWRKNGAAIGGATSPSYTTPAETTSDNGAQVTVVVSDSAGSVTSNAATLTVNAATFLLGANPTSLSFGNVNTGSSKVLTVTLTNSSSSDVTISSVSISGAGFNPSGVSAGLIVTAGQTANLSVTFAPAAAGSVTGSVSVVSNASNSPATIALFGTGVQVVSHSVDLSWTASTSVVLGYNVYRSAQSGGPYTKLNSIPAALTNYTDSGVQSGQTYVYVVTAVDSKYLESVFSNEVSAIIPTP
jgi:beta-galactosidase